MKTIRIYSDFLCSECYSILYAKISENESETIRDEPVWCNNCKECVFSIEVMRREFMFDEKNSGSQTWTSCIYHGIEIIHISGAGITKSLESRLSEKNNGNR